MLSVSFSLNLNSSEVHTCTTPTKSNHVLSASKLPVALPSGLEQLYVWHDAEEMHVKFFFIIIKVPARCRKPIGSRSRGLREADAKDSLVGKGRNKLTIHTRYDAGANGACSGTVVETNQHPWI